jgi:hypothetical protein
MLSSDMTTLINNFNGGPAGTTLTTANTGQLGDNAFNSITTAASATIVFADAGVNALNRPTAQFVMELATTGTSGQSVAASWSTSMGAQAQIWTRFYVYFSSISPSTNDRIIFSAFSGITMEMSVLLQTATTPNSLYVKDKAGATVFGGTSFVAGVWNRVEMNVNFTAGSTSLFVYADPGADGLDYSDSITQTGANYGGATCNLFPLGLAVGYSEATPPTYFSNWQLNNTGFPGPAPFRQGLGSPAGGLTNPIAIHSDVN